MVVSVTACGGLICYVLVFRKKKERLGISKNLNILIQWPFGIRIGSDSYWNSATIPFYWELAIEIPFVSAVFDPIAIGFCLWQ
jgi:hypothetical protein